MRFLFLMAAVATPLTFAAVDAMADPQKVVDARRAYFKLIGSNMGPLGAIAKGAADYSAETAQLHAGNLLTMNGYNAAPHFAAGTSNADLPGKTRLLPKAFEDFDGMLAKYNDYKAAVEELAAVAGNGLDALKPAVGKLGGTCKACHDDYRAKDF